MERKKSQLLLKTYMIITSFAVVLPSRILAVRKKCLNI